MRAPLPASGPIASADQAEYTNGARGGRTRAHEQARGTLSDGAGGVPADGAEAASFAEHERARAPPVVAWRRGGGGPGRPATPKAAQGSASLASATRSTSASRQGTSSSA